MRMWMLPTSYMCDRHLLGEHVELHMFVGALNKGKNIHGYLDGKLLEIHNIIPRHDELVSEMSKRGMIHKSPLPVFNIRIAGKVDTENNLADLMRRCAFCRDRIKEKQYGT